MLGEGFSAKHSPLYLQPPSKTEPVSAARASQFRHRSAFFAVFFGNVRNYLYNMSLVRVPDEALCDHNAVSLQ